MRTRLTYMSSALKLMGLKKSCCKLKKKWKKNTVIKLALAV